MGIRWLSAPFLLLHAAVFGCTVSCGTEARLRAQDANPHFEVVSIKRARINTSDVAPRFDADGTATFINQSVRLLLLRMSSALPREIANLPDWVGDRYDIVLKLPPGAKPTPDTWRNVLVERFKLQAHSEEQQRDGLALVLARADGGLGPNLILSTLDCDPKPSVSPPSTPAARPPLQWPTREEMAGRCGEMTSNARGFMVSGGMDMPMLASSIGGLIGQTYMSDQTGLRGYYAVELNFPPTRFSAGATAPEPSGVLKAMEAQLGLRVEPAQVQIPVLVIDHVERPSEN